jgi:hypothetical protein
MSDRSSVGTTRGPPCVPMGGLRSIIGHGFVSPGVAGRPRSEARRLRHLRAGTGRAQEEERHDEVVGVLGRETGSARQGADLCRASTEAARPDLDRSSGAVCAITLRSVRCAGRAHRPRSHHGTSPRTVVPRAQHRARMVSRRSHDAPRGGGLCRAPPRGRRIVLPELRDTAFASWRDWISACGRGSRGGCGTRRLRRGE